MDDIKNSIAVIGMGCWYPGAQDIKQMWENILAGRRQYRRFPDKRLPLSEYHDSDPGTPDKTYGRRAAVIDGFEFDWAGKRITKTAFESSDIVHWLALEVASRAVEDAGYTRENINKERTGVFLGNSLTGEQARANMMRLRWPFVRRTLRAAVQSKGLDNTALRDLEEEMERLYKSVFPPITEDSLAGGLSNTIAGRICNYFDFDGGGFVVDAACASSLLAIANAANALKNTQLDIALAGGVDISLDPFEMVGFAKVGALAKEEMKVFDKDAKGFIPGEGCGFVVLKRLEDARRDGNYVYSVIKGWGISSDGKGGITAPEPVGQSKAFQRAYELAGYSPHTIRFVEAHGTGTTKGDRVELEGLAMGLSHFGEPEARSCGITSVKSIIGHTKAAAGVAGFIKACLSVNQRVLPPTFGCKEPNEVFDTKAVSVYPILRGEMLEPDTTIRAGAFAAGFGGINCHVTLESGDKPAPHVKPSIDERTLMASHQISELFLVCSKDIPSILERVREVKKMADGMSVAEMVDFAQKLSQELDASLPVRAAIISQSPDHLIDSLEELAKNLETNPPAEGYTWENLPKNIYVGNKLNSARLGFLFPGQGSQKINMAYKLIERFSWARQLVDDASMVLRDFGINDFKNLIYRRIERAKNKEERGEWEKVLSNTEVAQPAICLASLLWYKYLLHLGITPTAVSGHSLGELSAFYAAGAFDEKQLIHFAAVRGKAMSASSGEAGTMASLGCSKETAESLLSGINDYAVVANINSPSQTVISGSKNGVEEAVKVATSKGIKALMLPVSNAFHSKMVSKAGDYLLQNAPIPEKLGNLDKVLISGMGGHKVESGVDLKGYFSKQVTEKVNFVSVVEQMVKECDLLIEVGPSPVLSRLVSANLNTEDKVSFPVESSPGNDTDLNVFLGNYFISGGQVKWDVLYENRLIRPFVPASEKKFIENPIEKPFDVGESAQSVSQLEHSLGEALDVPSDVLSEYLSRRGKFITSVIRADLDTLTFKHDKVPLKRSLKETPPTEKQAQQPTEKQAQDTPKANTPANDVRSAIMELATKYTGYPQDSITPEARLQDELNLDSIKAGALVADAVKLFNAQDKIEPSEFANSKIGDIIQKIESVVPKSIPNEASSVKSENTSPQPEKENEDATSVLVNLVAKYTGFPIDSITPEARLQDDLNLDSIKAGALVADAAKLFNAHDKIEPSKFTNATIIELAKELSVFNVAKKEVNKSQEDVNNKADVQEEAKKQEEDQPKYSNWVRNYAVISVKEPRKESGEFDWKTANVLIIHYSEDLDIKEQFKEELDKLGAKVGSNTFEEIIAGNTTGDYTHIISILPHKKNPNPPNEERLRSIMEKLKAVTVFAISNSKERKTTIAYVQWGGGFFGAEVGVESSATNFEQCCCSAFASSLHLENSSLKVRVIDVPLSLKDAAVYREIITEIETPPPYMAVGFDTDGARRMVKMVMQEPSKYQKRPISWSADDVILVTGGARGITAECALALAKFTGAKMALVGSTPPPKEEDASEKSKEVRATLKRFEEANITYRYYQCDITDFQWLTQVAKRIQEEMGDITGVLHGAGMNRPARIEHVSAESAFSEIKPKVVGSFNLYGIFQEKQPKFVAAMSSIIGVTGMPGNAWYGFSNQVLNFVINILGVKHPETSILVIAYSIWEEVGMGARMGSVEKLAKMGISSIPVEEGVRRFIQLVDNDAGVNPVIVTSRITSLHSLKPKEISMHQASRFLEQITYYQPQVEVISRVKLHLDTDFYLKDHFYRGTYLFPTVFGLEAMAQVVGYVTGVNDFNSVAIENINLHLPIVVDPEKGTTIEIRALAREYEPGSDLKYVDVEIKTEQTGFINAHFSATFVLNTQSQLHMENLEIPGQHPDIDSAEDLYGKILFQGPRFQRIKKVYSLDTEKHYPRKCLFASELNPSVVSGEDTFSSGIAKPLLFGDPYFRDTLLQSIQLLVTPDVCLPVYIKRLEKFKPISENQTLFTIQAVLENREDNNYIANVLVVDEQGNVVEKIEGYKLRIMQRDINFPEAEELADFKLWDEKILRGKLKQYSEAFKVNVPEITIDYLVGLHEQPKEQRHEREQELFKRNIARLANDKITQEVKLNWLESGKPVVEGTAQLAVSFSHKEDYCMCVIGEGFIGCDFEAIEKKSTEDWSSLLTPSRQNLLEDLRKRGDSQDYAGTRIWSATEAVSKATDTCKHELELEMGDIKEHGVLLYAKTQNTKVHVLTFPIKLSRGNERIMTFIVGSTQNEPKDVNVEKPAQPKAQGRYTPYVSGYFNEDKVYIDRFVLSFKELSSLGRMVPLSNFNLWMGRVREIVLHPLAKDLEKLFARGSNWAMLTRNSRTRLVDEARYSDTMEVHLQLVKSNDPSRTDINFEWYKVLPDDNIKLVAVSNMETAWATMLEHGIGKAVPGPDFYLKYMEEVTNKNVTSLSNISNAPGFYSSFDTGKEFFKKEILSSKPLVYESVFETTQQESNLVGNIYFATYTYWQERTTKMFFYEVVPRLYSGVEHEEMVCVYNEMYHIREAMPFDDIMVKMYLLSMHERKVGFYFELFEYEGEDRKGTIKKFAAGIREYVAVRRNPDGNPTIVPLPQEIASLLPGQVKPVVKETVLATH